MINLHDGLPVAIDAGSVIYVGDEDDDGLLDQILRSTRAKVSDAEVDALLHDRPVARRLRTIADALARMREQAGEYDAIGVLQVLPLIREDQVDIGYVVGPTGSGKSRWVHDYACQYHLIYPDNAVWLVSRKEADPSLDEPWMTRVTPESIGSKEETDVDPLESFEDSLVIFDDIDTLDDSSRERVYKLRDDLIQCGRDRRIYSISTSHQFSSGRVTKGILNESNFLVVFPERSNAHVSKYVQEYVGLNKRAVDRIFALRSRWVYIHRHRPRFVTYERGIYLL